MCCMHENPFLLLYLTLFNVHLPSHLLIKGMDVVDQMYAGYGEGAPAGKGPNQGLIQARGNSYLKEYFPKLSYVLSAK